MKWQQWKKGVTMEDIRCTSEWLAARYGKGVSGT